MRKEGFHPFAVAQAQPKMEGKFEHARFCVRFRHESTQSLRGGAPELIATGSSDGSSAATLIGGWVEFACFNGLVTGELLEEIKVRHTGDIVESYIAGAFTLLHNFDRIKESREEMRSIELLPQEQLIFANSAMTLKYENPNLAPITAEQLLRPRRKEDNNGTLWSTFNKVQEHLVKGGLSGRTEKNKRTTTRPINAIQANVGINKALWALAEAMKRLKDPDSLAAQLAQIS
jgi:hypothetical protein